MSLQLSDGHICHFGQRLLCYTDSLGEDVLGLDCSSTAHTKKKDTIFTRVQVNILNYIIAALTALNTLRDLILASPPTASSSLGSLSCWWGDRHPLIAAKDECVQCKRRESVQRSTSLQLLNQSWQGSASTDMRCSEENVCVCMCESHTHTQHISIYKGVCVYVHSLG